MRRVSAFGQGFFWPLGKKSVFNPVCAYFKQFLVLSSNLRNILSNLSNFLKKDKKSKIGKENKFKNKWKKTRKKNPKNPKKIINCQKSKNLKKK